MHFFSLEFSPIHIKMKKKHMPAPDSTPSPSSASDRPKRPLDFSRHETTQFQK